MSERRDIAVFADWLGLGGATFVGHLHTTPSRGRELFSFEYDRAWLESPHCRELDPGLGLFRGPQYPQAGRDNFGMFLDSCPDRWGRVLMQRREAYRARLEGRPERRLVESDYLLGVHDLYRVGALRFRTNGTFLDNDEELAAPPWAHLRELEHASRELERDGAESDSEYGHWLRMLIAPGGSLGGARPKASVVDENGSLWIAKFPSRRDDDDIGAWEAVVHELAESSGIGVPEASTRRFASEHTTYLSRRFDRTPAGERHHFASAMTLLERRDGDGSDEGASYLELADLLIRLGANTTADLEQLWRRMVFFVCVSNTDDHLRNHGLLLTNKGWVLAPAYDMNPDPYGEGLRLNISETDNAQDLDLLRDVAPYWRVKPERADEIIDKVVAAVRHWREVARTKGLSESSIAKMRRAFHIAEEPGSRI